MAKSRGQSGKFLRALRRKYRLGEFKRKSPTRSTSRKSKRVKSTPGRFSPAGGGRELPYGVRAGFVGPSFPLMAAIIPPSSPVATDPAEACKGERNNPTSEAVVEEL